MDDDPKKVVNSLESVAVVVERKGDSDLDKSDLPAADVAVPPTLNRGDQPRPGAFAVAGIGAADNVSESGNNGEQPSRMPPASEQVHNISALLVSAELVELDADSSHRQNDSKRSNNSKRASIIKAERMGWRPSRRQFLIVVGLLVVAVGVAVGLGLGLGDRNGGKGPPSRNNNDNDEDDEDDGRDNNDNNRRMLRSKQRWNAAAASQAAGLSAERFP